MRAATSRASGQRPWTIPDDAECTKGKPTNASPGWATAMSALVDGVAVLVEHG